MLIRTLAALASLLAALPAAAGIVDIDAFDNRSETPVEIELPAGAYVVLPLDVAMGGAFTATNFWGVVEDCDVNGANCRFGWIWQYVFASDSIPETSIAEPTRWATPELAFAVAPTTTFDLYQTETVRFYFTDGEWEDNEGGVSLAVVPVPEPARAALLLVGGLCLALLRPRS
jgi:hypothetical protein